MAQNNTNRTVMILAGMVVVLLVAFVGVVMLTLNGNNNANTTSTTTAANTGVSTTGTSTAQQGMSPSGSGTFDPTTATKVPASQTPKAFVSAYYQAILDKKWDVAFKMQPAASQQGQTVAAFQQTQEQMYGMTAFTIFSAVEGSADATVVARQELGSNGIWNTTWTFVKANGSWLVDKRIPLAGEPK
jgi:hypothetical protein